MEKPDISIVIPACNEEGAIKSVIEDVQREIKKIKHSFEIIVVDDGSTDKTASIASKTGAKVVSHPYNKGYGASLKTGAMNSRGNYVLYLDGDGQHYAEDIEKIVSGIEKYDMIVGARSRQASLLRGFGKVMLHALANYLVERKIPDLNSGFRLIKRNLILERMHMLPNSFSFTTTITLALIKDGYNVGYVPIRIRNRETGKSAIHPFRNGFRFTIQILRMTMLFDPLRVLLPVSILLFIAGLPLLISRLILYQRTSETAMLFILSSSIVFFFGLIADQISILVRRPR